MRRFLIGLSLVAATAFVGSYGNLCPRDVLIHVCFMVLGILMGVFICSK